MLVIFAGLIMEMFLHFAQYPITMVLLVKNIHYGGDSHFDMFLFTLRY